MKKGFFKITFNLLFLFLLINNTYSQSFQLRGLELYNFQNSNPAYIINDSRLQFDFIPYNFKSTNQGFKSDLFTYVPNLKSGFGIGFQRGNMDPAEQVSFDFNYAYKYVLFESINIMTGIRMNYTRLYFKDASFTDFPTIYRKGLNSAIGMVFRIKKIHTSASIGLPISSTREVFISNNETITEKVKNPKPSYHFLCGYSLGKKNRILFEPILSLDYAYDRTSWYIGANSQIKNKVGIGFTAGSLKSVSASLKFMDKLFIILGIYSAEKNMDVYSFNIKGPEYVAQLRIKL